MRKKKGNEKLYSVSRKPLIFAAMVSFALVLSTAVSTFAWFQANAQVNIQTTSTSATITVSQPDLVKFYYFKGNGTPGSDYTGYSATNAAFGNTSHVVNTSTGQYSLGGASGSFSDIGASAAWGLIDISTSPSGTATVANCFNFSKMRAGCYYSFCVDWGLTGATLNTTFSWSEANTGAGTTKRYLYNSGRTNNPLNLLMAINGYCANLGNMTTSATAYIKETLGVNASGDINLTDKIVYSTSDTSAKSYQFLNVANVSSNKYIYFTIFMGKSDRSDAYLFQETYDGKNYYANSSSGSYVAFDGLSASLVNVSLT